MIGLDSYQSFKTCDVCGRAYTHSARFARCPDHEHIVAIPEEYDDDCHFCGEDTCVCDPETRYGA